MDLLGQVELKWQDTLEPIVLLHDWHWCTKVIQYINTKPICIKPFRHPFSISLLSFWKWSVRLRSITVHNNQLPKFVRLDGKKVFQINCKSNANWNISQEAKLVYLIRYSGHNHAADISLFSYWFSICIFTKAIVESRFWSSETPLFLPPLCVHPPPLYFNVKQSISASIVLVFRQPPYWLYSHTNTPPFSIQTMFC